MRLKPRQKDPEPGEVRAALGGDKLTLDELRDMPDIIRKMEVRGLVKFPNSERYAREIHRRKV